MVIKFQDLKKKSIDQLKAELLVIREEQFKLRMKHRTGQLNETDQLSKLRKNIAQIKTLINENNEGTKI